MMSQDVRLSVRPSHAGIVLKWLNNKRIIKPGRPIILVFSCQTLWQYLDGN